MIDFKKFFFATALLIGLFSVPNELGATPTLKLIQSRAAFEVATIKPSTPGDRGGKFAIMQSAHQFVARNYKVKDLVSFAYDLPPRLISGGPTWSETDNYNILAGTPGEERPSLNEQMAMVQTLLVDRFKLGFHTEPKEMPVYVLTVANGGIKFNESAKSDAQPPLVNVVYPVRLRFGMDIRRHTIRRKPATGSIANPREAGLICRAAAARPKAGVFQRAH